MGAKGMETARENKSTGQSLGEILRSAMKDLAQQNSEAYDILLLLAEEGSLEQHRTSGELDDIARRLLGTLGTGEGGDAD